MEKRFSIKVNPGDFTFETSEAVSVMEAAMLAGVDVPASCRNGTCRTCLCKMQSGTIRYRIEWPGVSPEEKKEGLILPCVAVAESDLVLNIPYAKLRQKS